MGFTGRSRRWWVISAAILTIVLCALLTAANVAARRFLEKNALTTGPNGPETPQVPFERVGIPSGSRKLDSYVVAADKRCLNAPALVIYHSSHETISEWTRAQEFLYRHCVSSLVFDPTGSGNSPRPARLSAVNEDAVAVYEFARDRFGGAPVFVMGHSLGNGPMLEAVPHMSTPPAGVIVANTFVSLRSEIVGSANLGVRTVAHMVPDWWDNVASVEKLDSPVLVIHSDRDEVYAVEGAHEVFAACHRPRTQIILYGFSHDALFQDPVEKWWSGVFGFMASPVKDGPNRRNRDRVKKFREAGL